MPGIRSAHCREVQPMTTAAFRSAFRSSPADSTKKPAATVASPMTSEMPDPFDEPDFGRRPNSRSTVDDAGDGGKSDAPAAALT